MSLKDLFKKGYTKKSVAEEGQKIKRHVESRHLIKEKSHEKRHIVPYTDFSDPANFAFYGSAEKYYEDSYTKIYMSYPYDGSHSEKTEWRNGLSYVDRYIFESEYPRTNGYIKLGHTWGALVGTYSEYGAPATASYEYIKVKGGPGLGLDSDTSASLAVGSARFDVSGKRKKDLRNIFNFSTGRTVNLNYDLDSNLSGSTVELWLKKESFSPSTTKKEVLFDLWNNEASSSSGYGRLTVEMSASQVAADPCFRVTAQSGTAGFFNQQIGVGSPSLTSSVADGSWHHYAFSFINEGSNVRTKLYIDGQLNDSQLFGTKISPVTTGSFTANIGALISPPSGNTYHNLAMTGFGKLLSSSVDEFRYWRTKRTSEEIGRHWYTQVNGGTNTDNNKHDKHFPVELGVYYKFNEGITGTSAIDSIVLDYSGRMSNGIWTGYASGNRNTGSAILSASAASSEYEDPIVYSAHPTVQTNLSALKLKGRAHDGQNPSYFYRSFPMWIQNEDREGNLLKLTQIASSYFDNLYLQVKELPKLKQLRYVSGSQKPIPFYEKMLESKGLITPELFIDADLIELFQQRNEDKAFKRDLHDVKNLIYQNIYNNLSYIFKSKGTEKSFRNMIRCFGIDDELIKLNLYANNSTFTFEDSYVSRNLRRNILDLNNSGSFGGTVYQLRDPSNSETVSFVSGTSGDASLTGSIFMPFTFESETVFARKPDSRTSAYFNTSFLSSSIMGMHLADTSDLDDATWASSDETLQVYAVRPKVESKHVRFVLTGSLIDAATLATVHLTSSLYPEVYDDSKWNFAVRMRHQEFPRSDFLRGSVMHAPTQWHLEFVGFNSSIDTIENQFSVTASVSEDTSLFNFLEGPKRVYVGAHRTNFSGAVLVNSDVNFVSARYWQSYLDDDVIKYHSFNSDNFGTENPYKNAYFLQNVMLDSGSIKVPEASTLALHWNFDNVTGSDASGQFIVEDFSSGSTSIAKAGWLDNILYRQHTGKGFGFPVSNSKVAAKDYVYVARQTIPEIVNNQNMVRILTTDDEIFPKDARPVNHFLSIEKNMYQTISEEMINMFASLTEFDNLIGHPVHRYRMEYKDLKKMGHLFFEKVENDIDLDRFVDFYKWIDKSLSYLLQQLIPASMDHSQKLYTTVESHILERNKYWNKYPTLEFQGRTIRTRIEPSPWRTKIRLVPPGGPSEQQQNVSPLWWKHDAERDKSPLLSGDSNVDSNREELRALISREYQRYIEHIASDHYKLEFVYKGGVNFHSNKKMNYVFAQTDLNGPTTSFKVPLNVLLAFKRDFVFETDLEKEKRNKVELDISEKSKVKFAFENNRDINSPGNAYSKVKGDLVAPFNLISSSVATGYNKAVQDALTSSVMITNLHNDSYGSNEIPMQSPFTNAHVGGLQHRHVNLNTGSDDISSRPEGWRLIIGPSATDPSDPMIGLAGPDYPLNFTTPADYPATIYKYARYYRDELAKRPINIRNINYTTASSVLGNFQNNYEVAQTFGRTENNLWFRYNNGVSSSYAVSSYVTGVVDFELPDRTTKKTKSVFVNRFSAPGGPEVNSRGFLDLEAEEYSVYNALPWRNLSVRQPLNQLSAMHAGPFGLDWLSGAVGGHFAATPAATIYPFAEPTSDFFGESTLSYDETPSYFKVNRNRLKSIMFDGSSATSMLTGSAFDNQFISHPIPRSDIQYAWITASAITTQDVTDRPGYLGYAPKDGYFSSSATGYVPAMTFVSASDFGSSEVLSLRQFWTADVSGLDQFVRTDFVGINSHIYEPLTASSNFLGYPPTTPLSSYLNRGSGPHFIFDASSLGDASALNALLLHRNGPYQHPSWKQIRGGEHPISRYFRKNNINSIVNDPKTSHELPPVHHYFDPLSRVNSKVATPRYIKNFTYTPITHKFKPVATHFKLKANDQDVVGRFTFKNSVVQSKFYEFDHLAGNKNEYTALHNNSFSRFIDYAHTLAKDKIARMGSLSKLMNLDIVETVYPRDINTGLKKIRLRDTYAESVGTADNGYGRRIDERRTFWAASGSRTRDPDGAGNYLNALGHVYGDSVWPLENKYIGSASNWIDNDIPAGSGHGYTLLSGTLGEWPYGGTSQGEMMLDLYTTGNVTLLDPNNLGMFQRESVISEGFHGPNDGDYTLATSYYDQPTASIFYAYLPELCNSGTTEFVFPYSVPELTGRNPFYDSYEAYSVDIKPQNKEYTIVPEFRISDHMEHYAKKIGRTNDKYLSMLGGDHTSSADANLNGTLDLDFYETYANSDFLDTPMAVKSILATNNSQETIEPSEAISKISINCKAIKKCLPYNGFYPITRTAQLASLLSQSVAPYISGSHYNQAYSASLAVQSLMQPFFAPGIMFNTIKSGIAVDYPVYTASLGDLDKEVHMGTEQVLEQNHVTIKDIPDFRIPFESLVNLDKAFPKSSYFVDAGVVGQRDPTKVFLTYTDKMITASAGTLDVSVRYPYYTFEKDKLAKRSPLYENAMNNFLGESVRFFQDGLSYFKSAKSKHFEQTDSGKTYYMDVVLRKTDDFHMIRSSVKDGLIVNPGATSHDGEIGYGFKRYYNGRYFGPPVQFMSSSTGYSGSMSTMSDPAYAPFTPPYFYGESIARFAFAPTESRRYSLSEILASSSIEYINTATNGNPGTSSAGILKRYYDNSVDTDGLAGNAALKSMMHISSSVNLLNYKTVSIFEIQAGGDNLSTFNPGSADEDVWVISTKYETPAMNFSSSVHPTNHSGAVGMWSTHANPLNETLTEGIFLELRETFDPSVLNSATVGSLLQLCKFDNPDNTPDPPPTGGSSGARSRITFQRPGLSSTRRKIGQISEKKTIHEGIIAIPYLDNGIAELTIPIKKFVTNTSEDRHLFKITKDVFQNQYANVKNGDPAVKKGDQARFGYAATSDIQETSISNMIRRSRKYQLPPHLDFITEFGTTGENKNVDPFVMYIFDFSVTFDKEDLGDIWQGVMPKAKPGNGFAVDYDEDVFEHNISVYDFYEASMEFTKLVGGGHTKIKWLVFKVKQRGETLYRNISSPDALGKPFDPEIQNEHYNDSHSYNWPYDFLSVVESAKVDVNIRTSVIPLSPPPTLTTGGGTQKEKSELSALREIVDSPNVRWDDVGDPTGFDMSSKLDEGANRGLGSWEPYGKGKDKK